MTRFDTNKVFVRLNVAMVLFVLTGIVGTLIGLIVGFLIGYFLWGPS
jgi:hypothetical protein